MVDVDQIKTAVDDVSARDSLFKPYFSKYSKDQKTIMPAQITEIIMEICDETGLLVPTKSDLDAARSKESSKSPEDEGLSYEGFLRELKVYLFCLANQ